MGYSDGDRVALPFTEVAGIAERKADLGKSLVLGIGIPVVMVGLFYLAACTGTSSGFDPC